jgi:hypothetical protein
MKGFMKATTLFVLSVWIVSMSVWAQQGQRGQEAPQPQPQGQRGGGRNSVPPRIMQFDAKPSSIKPGESVTLIWLVENSGQVTISGLGGVTNRGSKAIKPVATTTLTLTAGAATKTVTVTVAGTTPVSPDQAFAIPKKGIPRTADGKVDFTGVYDFRPPAGATGGGRGARGAGAAAAGPQLKPGMESYRVVTTEFDYGGTCMPNLPPGSYGSPYQFQIVQTRNQVLIFYEYPGTFRVVPIDGTPHSVDPDPTWMGESVGWYEGDILVIDTIGYNDKTTVGGRGGFRHSEKLHTVERFRRTEDALEITVTTEDSDVFVAPWTQTSAYRYMPELKKIGEFVCENNRDYRPLFGNPAATNPQRN